MLKNKKLKYTINKNLFWQSIELACWEKIPSCFTDFVKCDNLGLLQEVRVIPNEDNLCCTIEFYSEDVLMSISLDDTQMTQEQSESYFSNIYKQIVEIIDEYIHLN